MKTASSLTILIGVFALAACSAQSLQAPDEGVSMRIGGDNYVIINQLTASTWTATAAEPGKPLAGASANRVALQRAIEAQSGCKVSDSDFSRQGMQFDAQVECEGALKN